MARVEADLEEIRERLDNFDEYDIEVLFDDAEALYREVKWLQAQVEKLREGLESLKRIFKYHCPGCSSTNSRDEGPCDCHVEDLNARIDALLADTKGE